jgi:ribosome-associated protein
LFNLPPWSALPACPPPRAVDRLGGRLAHGVLTVASSGERSQLMNRQEARARLADLMRDAVAAPPRARVATKPSRAARERRLADKRRRSQAKRDRNFGAGRPE